MAITILELAKHRGLKEEPDGSFSMGANQRRGPRDHGRVPAVRSFAWML